MPGKRGPVIEKSTDAQAFGNREMIDFPPAFFNFRLAATYPSGKGELCKSFIQRFESACRLHFSHSEIVSGAPGRAHPEAGPSEANGLSDMHRKALRTIT